jgi:hypothetical protein
MSRIQTRVRQAEHSDIVKISKVLRKEIMSNSKTNRGGYGVSQMVRDLGPDEGFFIICENDRKFSHVYTAAKSAGKKVTVVPGEHEGCAGFWVLTK